MATTVAPSGGRAGARQVVLPGRTSNPHGGAWLEPGAGPLLAAPDEPLPAPEPAPDEGGAAEVGAVEADVRDDATPAELPADDVPEAGDPADDEVTGPDEAGTDMDDDDNDVEAASCASWSAGRGGQAASSRQAATGHGGNGHMRGCDGVWVPAPVRARSGCCCISYAQRARGAGAGGPAAAHAATRPAVVVRPPAEVPVRSPSILLAAVVLLGLVGPVARGQEDEPTAPVHGEVEVRGNELVFHWSPVPGARSYRLQVARSLLFRPAAVDRRTGMLSVSTRVLPRGHYYWRVSAVLPNGDIGPFSASELLVLTGRPTEPRGDEAPPPVFDAPPTPPVPAAPAPASPAGTPAVPRPPAPSPEPICRCPPSGSVATVRFRWKGRARRRLQVAEDGTFGSIVADRVVAAAAMELRLPTGNYHWRWAPHAGWTPDVRWSEVRRVFVRCDDQPPALHVVSPMPRTFATRPAVTLEGTTDRGASVWLNGRALDVDATGAFVVHLGLRPGTNELHLEARDSAGNETHRALVVTMFRDEKQSVWLDRVFALQRQLNLAEERRVGLARRLAELERTPAAQLGTSAPAQVAALSQELHSLRLVKRELSAALSAMAMELQPSVGIRFPPAGARVIPLVPPPPPPPPAPDRPRRKR
ncbi:MAG: hypothetical protein HY904_08515 [Deltaproteobacteria bacterium]|nr:hypothetical protein [Deltaproteobacteria bacterium]